MRRISVFLKGNVDIYDSLHSCTIADQLQWNGVNEVVRRRFPGTLIRLRHETWTRSDALLQAAGSVPEELASRTLPLGTYPASSQFSKAVFEADPAAFVFSMQPDIMTGLYRHRGSKFLLYPNNLASWSADDKAWLKQAFEPLGTLDLDQSLANLEAIINRIRESSCAPILIYNLSPIVPGEIIHCYQGIGETYSTRIRRFNLGLTALSEKTGISIIDVDALLARAGADRFKLDAIHLSAEGYELIAIEVVRVLEELGAFEIAEAPICAQV